MPDEPTSDPGSGAVEPQATAEMFATIGRRLAAYATTADAVQALTALTVQVVPGARWVSVTRGLRTRFTTMASSDPVAAAADHVQYELGTGPCVDAVRDEAVFESADLAHDDRWSGFGPRAASECGTRSVLSMRLTMDGDEDLNAGLNIYGDRVGAFDDTSRYLATLLATHAAIAVTAVVNRERALHLRQAVDSNREIGVAMGVLMSAHSLTREQAFDLLRIASQNTNRKLHDIATDVADSGALDLESARHPR